MKQPERPTPRILLTRAQEIELMRDVQQRHTDLAERHKDLIPTKRPE